MKKMKMTNAVRIVEQAGIECEVAAYDTGKEFTNGVEAAGKAGIPAASTYKTLVTEGRTGEHYVYVIPVADELDMKKAARAVGEKSVEMLPHRELTAVTGYIKGGCSPVGMKKRFRTVIEAKAEELPLFYVSAGKPGMFMGLAPQALRELTGAEFRDVTI